MSRTVVPLSRDVLAQLPLEARGCVYWEVDPVRRAHPMTVAERIAAKEEWVSRVLLEWGRCGQVLLVDGVPAGYMVYAPPDFVPSAAALPTAPVSADALLLTTGQVLPGFRSTGVGRVLVQAAVKDAARRRLRAVEAFAARRAGHVHPAAADPCLLPVGFLSAVGFRTTRQHPLTPRLRLDVRSTASWREDVESAVDKLLGTIRPATAPARA